MKQTEQTHFSRTSRQSSSSGTKRNQSKKTASDIRSQDTAAKQTRQSRQQEEKRLEQRRSDQRAGSRKISEKAAAERAAKIREQKEARARSVDEYYGTENPNLLIGRNAVSEALKSGRTIDKILMQKDAEGSAKKIASMARERGIPVQYVEKVALDRIAPGRPHQGVAAYAAAHEYTDLDRVLENAKEKGEDPLLVILDGIEDPHNLGAILRSADGAGAHGVIIPARRAVGLTEVVAKASAGAIEYVPVVKVGNLSQAIDELKSRGLWIVAVDMDGVPYCGANLKGPLALVIGAEGSGVSRLVREKCDLAISIPMRGHVSSLNASNAAAIALYEAARQRN